MKPVKQSIVYEANQKNIGLQELVYSENNIDIILRNKQNKKGEIKQSRKFIITIEEVKDKEI